MSALRRGRDRPRPPTAGARWIGPACPSPRSPGGGKGVVVVVVFCARVQPGREKRATRGPDTQPGTVGGARACVCYLCCVLCVRVRVRVRACVHVCVYARARARAQVCVCAHACRPQRAASLSASAFDARSTWRSVQPRSKRRVSARAMSLGRRPVHTVCSQPCMCHSPAERVLF